MGCACGEEETVELELLDCKGYHEIKGGHLVGCRRTAAKKRYRDASKYGGY